MPCSRPDGRAPHFCLCSANKDADRCTSGPCAGARYCGGTGCRRDCESTFNGQRKWCSIHSKGALGLRVPGAHRTQYSFTHISLSGPGSGPSCFALQYSRGLYYYYYRPPECVINFRPGLASALERCRQAGEQTVRSWLSTTSPRVRYMYTGDWPPQRELRARVWLQSTSDFPSAGGRRAPRGCRGLPGARRRRHDAAVDEPSCGFPPHCTAALPHRHERANGRRRP